MSKTRDIEILTMWHAKITHFITQDEKNIDLLTVSI